MRPRGVVIANLIRIACYVEEPDGTGAPSDYTAHVLVLLEEELHDEVTLAEATMEQMEQADEDGLFAVVETLDFPEGASERKIAGIVLRRSRDRLDAERMMASLYHIQAALLDEVGDHGLVLAAEPQPLGVGDAMYVMNRLARHTSYESQQVYLPLLGEAETVIQIEDGIVSTFDHMERDDRPW